MERSEIRGETWPMVAYRRNFLPGGTFFFTVAFANRRSSALIDYADSLRAAFRLTRKERPFSIDAIVILPDHLHVMFTLPLDDSDFSGRWRRIKSLFTRQAVARGFSAAPNDKGEYGLWQRRFWEHTIRNEKDFARHPITSTIIRSNMDWSLKFLIGAIRLFTATSGREYCRRTGAAKSLFPPEDSASPSRRPDAARSAKSGIFVPAFRFAPCGLRRSAQRVGERAGVARSKTRMASRLRLPRGREVGAVPRTRVCDLPAAGRF